MDSRGQLTGTNPKHDRNTMHTISYYTPLLYQASGICMDELNSLSGFRGLNSGCMGNVLALLPTGHTPLRAVRWTAPRCSARITFSAKLAPVAGVGGASTEGSAIFDPFSRTATHVDARAAASVGYSWRVSVYDSSGDYYCFEQEGGCLSQNQSVSSATNEASTTDSKHQNPLIPWTWRYFSLDLGKISSNDVVVISGIAECDSPNSNIINRCSLQVKDCQLFADATQLAASAKTSNICGAGADLQNGSGNLLLRGVSGSAASYIPTTSIAFAVHNNPKVRNFSH